MRLSDCRNLFAASMNVSRQKPASDSVGISLALLTTLCLTLVLALLIGTLLLSQRLEKTRTDLALARLELYLGEVAQPLENGLRFGLLLGEIGGGQRAASGILEKDPNIRFIGVFDDKGDLVVQAGQASFKQSDASKDLWLRIRSLRDATNIQVGEVWIAFSARQLNEEIGQQHRILLYWALSLAAAGLIVAAFYARQTALKTQCLLDDMESELAQAHFSIHSKSWGQLAIAHDELDRIERQAAKPSE